MKNTSIIEAARKKFHSGLLAEALTVDDDGIPTNADKNNKLSCGLAKQLASRLGKPVTAKKKECQTLGSIFEEHVAKFLVATFHSLEHLRPGEWEIGRSHDKKKRGITAFDQYAHLADLEELLDQNPKLAATLGSDYLIKPDVMLFRSPVPDSVINKNGSVVDGSFAKLAPIRAANQSLSLLHATVSCKWTIRSDRSQNSRSEALNLIRNRKGKLPHIAVVTAEPLPSRLASLALGTGDIDCVYHFALNELLSVVDASEHDDAKELLNVMVSGKRLRDISDLPLDLVV